MTVWRKTVAPRLRKTLHAVRDMRRRMHGPGPQQGAELKRVLLGHDRYYDAVPRNGKLLRGFRDTSRR